MKVLDTLLPAAETAVRAAYIYLAASAVMSIVTFAVFGTDKHIARKNGASKQKKAMRVPEKTLLLLAFLLGSPGAALGMIVFRHKTRKLKFAVGVPVMLLCWLAAAALLYYKAFGPHLQGG